MIGKVLLVYFIQCLCLDFSTTKAEDFQNGAAMDDIIKANDGMLGNFYEGDIPIIQSGTIDKRFNKLWPNGVLPYAISDTFSEQDKQRIRNAVATIRRAAPCINFIEYKSNPPTDHISVFIGNGCWSWIGRVGGTQQLSLGRGCLGSGTIMHEFLHALGFYHEQSRPDRDQYVRINLQNVYNGQEHNFRISNNINSLKVPYDRSSVMHYSKYAFSKNRQPTVEWKDDPNLPLGGNVLTEKDQQQLNLLYCGGQPTTTRTTTRRTTTRRTTTKPTTTKRTTTRPTTTKRTTTKPKVCGDKHIYCTTIRRGTRCDSWMRIYCPRTCRICRGPPSEKCMNFRDRRWYCYWTARNGGCRSRRAKRICTKSCCEAGKLYK